VYEDVDRIHLAEDRVQYHTFLNTVMNLQGQLKLGNFLTG